MHIEITKNKYKRNILDNGGLISKKNLFQPTNVSRKIYSIYIINITQLKYNVEKQIYTYVGKFNSSRVAQHSPIWFDVASVVNELRIPYPVVVLTVCTLWKYSYRRPNKYDNWLLQINVAIDHYSVRIHS